MAQHSNHSSTSISISPVEGFCDLCVWKRWQPTTHYQPCVGRMNEIVSEAMGTKGGNYRTIEEDAKRQLLDEFCTDPNGDEDRDTDTVQQTARQNKDFCGECLWTDGRYTCNSKVENMVNVYSISRDTAIDAVLVDCIRKDGANAATVANTSSTSFIAIAAFILAKKALALLIYVMYWVRKRMRKQTQATSSIEMSKSKLVAGVILGLAFISIYRVQYQSVVSDATATLTTPSSKHKPDDAHITLCNRRVYLKNMPPLPPSLKFGFPNDWERNFTKPGGAIILDNEFLYGRTGNNIREFFHAFDWARNEGVGLVVRERGFPMDKVSENTTTHLAISIYDF